MLAAILFTVSTVTFSRFAILYWRATIADASRAPVSDRVRAAAGISTNSLSSRDFRAILNVRELAPDLRGSGGEFRTIRAYFSILEKLGRLIPSVTRWAEAEMTMCSRYMAVVVDQHLERNIACAVRMRGI
jgi:hypothetical protein